MGRWRSGYKCPECGAILSDADYSWTKGVCVCGYNNYAGSRPRMQIISYRFTAPWWKRLFDWTVEVKE